MPEALIVDDDGSALQGLMELVTREGFTSRGARTVEEARSELRTALPDVVLTDLRLPDGSGLDLLPELDGNTTTQVVLITGHASVDSAVEALRRSEEHTSELQSPCNLVCRLLLEKKKKKILNFHNKIKNQNTVM